MYIYIYNGIANWPLKIIHKDVLVQNSESNVEIDYNLEIIKTQQNYIVLLGTDKVEKPNSNKEVTIKDGHHVKKRSETAITINDQIPIVEMHLNDRNNGTCLYKNDFEVFLFFIKLVFV